MNLRLLQRSPRLLALLLVFAPIVFVASVTRLHGQTAPGSFTLQQVLSAPFTSDLIAAPAKKRIAWVANIEGRNNLWVAEPGSQGFAARQLTHYTDDDGVGVNTPRWTADAGTIVYELGGSDEDEAKPTPNPAWLVKGAAGRRRAAADWRGASASRFARRQDRCLCARQRNMDCATRCGRHQTRATAGDARLGVGPAMVAGRQEACLQV